MKLCIHFFCEKIELFYSALSEKCLFKILAIRILSLSLSISLRFHNLKKKKIVFVIRFTSSSLTNSVRNKFDRSLGYILCFKYFFFLSLYLKRKFSFLTSLTRHV